MNADKMSDDGDILEIATRHLRESRTASMPSRELIGRTVAAMRQVPRPKTPWTAMALTAASLLLIIGAACWFISRGSGEIAFADVMQHVMQTKSFQATIIQVGDEREPHESARLSVKGPRGRFDTDDGLIIIDDDKTGDTITLDTKAKVACRSTEPINGNIDVYAELRQIASQMPKSIGKKNFDGQVLNGFSGTVTLMGKNGGSATVWVDPQSRLPARIELSLKPDGQPMAVIDNLKFDVALDDSMFDMTVPHGYVLRATLPMRAPRPMPRQSANRPSTAFTRPTVEIPLPQTPGSAPTAEELERLVLKPGIGIGELKFGATRQQIVKVLGEPQGVLRQGTSEILQYSSAGVVLAVDGPLGLQFIMANGPSTFNTPKVRPFAGSTDKGVRIGSTRAAIEAAYGKDYVTVGVRVMDHPEIRQTQLTYNRLGLLVIVDSGTDRCAGLWIAPPVVTKASTKPER
jgi:outer membrane lipoprotein-sorting protein